VHTRMAPRGRSTSKGARQHGRTQAHNVCDHVEEVVLRVGLHDLVGEQAAVEVQPQLDGDRQHHDAHVHSPVLTQPSVMSLRGGARAERGGNE